MKQIVVAAIFLAHAASPALAQDTDFYKGKTINLIIGSAESGMYDSGGRLMARLMPRYIPGAPTIVPRNMRAHRACGLRNSSTMSRRRTD